MVNIRGIIRQVDGDTYTVQKGKKYQLSKNDLVAVIKALFKEPNIRFEDGQTVWSALNDYRKAKPIKGKEADFSDALIVQKAKSMASAQKVDFGGVYSFRPHLPARLQLG